MAEKSFVVDEKAELRKRLRNKETLETIIFSDPNSPFKVESIYYFVLHSLKVSCCPIIPETTDKPIKKAYVKISAEFNFKESLIGDPYTWVIRYEERDSVKDACGRYLNFINKIKNGRCKTYIGPLCLSSSIEFS